MMASQPKTLKEIWEKVQKDFLKETGCDLFDQKMKLYKPLDLKIQERHLSTQSDKNEKSSKRERLVKVMNNVLTFIELTGGVLANVASQFFAPAGMCFNAVSFLIEGVRGVQAYHSQIADLFKQIGETMMYMGVVERIEGKLQKTGSEGLPAELVSTTSDVLQSFVTLCLYALKSIKDSKAKTAAKAIGVGVFKMDDAVANELANMETLVKKQRSLESTITLEKVLDIQHITGKIDQTTISINDRAKEILATTTLIAERTAQTAQNVSDIKATATRIGNATGAIAASNQRLEMKTNNIDGNTSILVNWAALDEERRSNNKKLHSIARALGICRTLETQSPPPLWEEQINILDDIKNRRAEKTGEWLLSQKSYLAWRDGSGSRILCVRGRKGTGKSFLVPKVVEDCSQAQNGADSKVFAYFFDENHAHRNVSVRFNSHDNPSDISTALRCIAYAFAEKSLHFAKRLQQTLNLGGPDLSSLSLKGLVEKFQITLPQTSPFYVIFDGLERISDSEQFIQILNELTSNMSTESGSSMFQPRFLLTINPDECDVSSRNRAKSLKLLDLGDLVNYRSPLDDTEQPFNQTDLEIIFKKEVSAQGIPLNPIKESGSFLEFKAEVIKASRGVFRGIEDRIRFVRQLIDNGDINTSELNTSILDQVNDLDKTAPDELDKLQKKLSAEDIADVNRVLNWLVYGCYNQMTMDQIDAVTYLARPTCSFPKFSIKLKEGTIYRKIFKINEDHIQVQDHIKSWLQSKESMDAMHDSKQAKISLKITIDHAEPKKVQEFLWHLDRKISHDNTFFTHPHDKDSVGTITIHKFSGYLNILHQALTVLMINPNKKTEILRAHAFKYLPVYVEQFSCLPNVTEGPEYNSEKVIAVVCKLAAFLNGENLASFVQRSANAERDVILNWMNNLASLDKFINREILQRLPLEQIHLLRALIDRCNGPGGCLFNMTSQMGIAWLLRDSLEIPKENRPGDSPLDWVATWVMEYVDRHYIEVVDADPHSLLPYQTASDTLVLNFSLSKRPKSIEENHNMSEPAEADSSISTQRFSYTGHSQQWQPSSATRIARAAKWVLESSDIATKNANFFKNLGLTYYAHGHFAKAIQSFKEALKISDNPKPIHRHLAKAYKCNSQIMDAITETINGAPDLAQTSVQNLEREEAMTMEFGMFAAQLLRKSDQPQLAIEIALASYQLGDYQRVHLPSYRELLDVHLFPEYPAEALSVILNLYETTNPQSSQNALTELLDHIIDSNEVPERILWQATKAKSLEEVLDKFIACLDDLSVLCNQSEKHKQDPQKQTKKRALVLLTRGYARALKRREFRGWELAYSDWKEALSTSESSISLPAAIAAANFQYEKHKSDRLKLIDKLGKINRKVPRAIPSALARAYMINGQHEEAMAQLRPIVGYGLQLLSDDDDRNDSEGFFVLSHPFACTGDTANALAAWSQLKPFETRGDAANAMSVARDGRNHNSNSGSVVSEEVQLSNTVPEELIDGPLRIECDGRCGKVWKFADDLWECIMCKNVRFCASCLKALKAGILGRWICHSSHEWYHVPPWNCEGSFQQKSGEICIPKRLEDGQWSSEQGEVIKVGEWKQRIKAFWKI